MKLKPRSKRKAVAKGKKHESKADVLADQLKAEGIKFLREYRFSFVAVGSPDKGIRKAISSTGLKDWRFDFLIEGTMFAVEVDGGTWSGGRHTRGAGFAEDCIKCNEAAILGYTVLRFTSDQVNSGVALSAIRRLMVKLP